MRWPARIAAGLVAALLSAGCGGGGTGDVTVPGCEVASYDKSNLPLLPVATSFTNNPLYYQQWAVHYDEIFYNANGIDKEASIHMDGGHNFLGRSVKVAIIDDALDVNHPDLAGHIVATYDVRSGSTDVRPRSDEESHGTAVTGVIAAQNNEIGPVGVAPGVSVYFIRLPFGDNVSISDIVAAFEKAKEWGVDVINCSWGSGDVDDAVKNAIQDLAYHGRDGKGTVVVFAAGNGGEDRQGDPIGNDESSLPEVFAVGATDKENLRAPYSNYGPPLDFMAPGGYNLGITTLDQNGTAGLSEDDYLRYNDYYAFAGTSASAPIVTGVVAQLLEANPTLTRLQVYNALQCSADKIGDIAYIDGRNDYYGYGKINANAALKLVR